MPNAPFARLCLADLYVQAQTVCSSLHHDERYARHLLSVAPPRTRSALESVADCLRRVIDRLEGGVLRDLAGRLEGAAGPLESEIAEDLPRLQILVEHAGIAVGDLEALVSRLPPGLAAPWTRLEASDATPTRILVKLAHEVRERLVPLRKVDGTRSLISIELAFQDEVYAYDDLGDGASPGAAQAVVVPTRLAYAPRYGVPLVTHEVCHASVRAWLARAEPEWQREEYQRRVGPFLYGVDETAMSSLADELLTETLVDALCVQLMGPAYVLAFAGWTFGRRPPPEPSLLSEAAPLGLRLRRLVHLTASSSSGRIGDAIDEIAGGLLPAGQRSGHAHYQAAVSDLIFDDRWLPAQLIKGVRSLGSAPLLNNLWESALLAFDEDPGWRALADRDEMRAFDDLREGLRWPPGMESERARTSRLLLVHRDVDDSWMKAVPHDVRTQAWGRPALGAADALLVLDNARVRHPDLWPADFGYVERTLGAEVVRWVGCTWQPRVPDERESAALVEVALLEHDLLPVLDKMPNGCFGASGRVARMFRVFGWADVAVLVVAANPGEVAQLVEELSPLASALRVHWLPAPEAESSEGLPVWAFLTSRTVRGEGGRDQRSRHELRSWADMLRVWVEAKKVCDFAIERVVGANP